MHGKTWHVGGQTPVAYRPGQRQSFSAASVVNANGAFWYCTYKGVLKTDLFVTLLALGPHQGREACMDSSSFASISFEEKGCDCQRIPGR